MSAYQETIRLFHVYSIQELTTIFNSFNGSVKWLDNCMALDILPISKLVRQYHAQIQKLLIVDPSEQTKVRTQQCAKHIGGVVTHLQIHDAISQKLDHMHVFQTGLIHDLANLQNIAQLIDNQYLSVCAEIVEMNKVQLGVIRTEYGQAVEAIQKDLKDTEKRMNPLMPEHSMPSYFHNYPAFEKAIDDLILKYIRVSETIYPLDQKVEDRAQKLYALAALFTMESERRVMSKILKGDDAAAEEESLSDADQTEFF